jgi:hypothetical protein
MLKELPALQEEFHRLGLVITKEDAAAATKLGDNFGKAKDQIKAVAFQVGAAVAGPLTDFLEWTQDSLKWVIDFVREHRSMVQAAAAIAFAIFGISAALIGLSYAVKGVKLALLGAKNVAKGLKVALATITAHPIIAAATAAALLSLYLHSGTENAEKLKKVLLTIFPFGRAVQKLKSSIVGEAEEGKPSKILGLPDDFSSGISAQMEKIQNELMAGMRTASTTVGLRPAMAASVASPGTNPGRFTGEELHPELREQTNLLRRMLREFEGGFPITMLPG